MLLLMWCTACATRVPATGGDGDVGSGDTGTGDTGMGGTTDGGGDTSDGGTGDGGTGDGGTGDGGTGDGGTSDGGTGDGGTGDGGTTAPDLRETGSWPVTVTTGSLDTTSGCGLSWTRYRAEGGPAVPLVVLSHGLQRTGEQMSTWAGHLASWGLDVVAPDLCNSNAWDLDQEQNGHDLVELAAAIAPGPVIYAGHSAGGLASIVATAADPEAVALLGLDPTEWDGIGEAVIGGVTLPVGLMVGDPGVCNLSNNALDLLADVEDLSPVRITEADHCDFEDPTDWVCTVACGTSSNDLFTDEEIGATIVGLATGYLAWQAGIEVEGQAWWEPGGAAYEALLSSGAISAP